MLCSVVKGAKIDTAVELLRKHELEFGVVVSSEFQVFVLSSHCYVVQMKVSVTVRLGHNTEIELELHIGLCRVIPCCFCRPISVVLLYSVMEGVQVIVSAVLSIYFHVAASFFVLCHGSETRGGRVRVSSVPASSSSVFTSVEGNVNSACVVV